MYNALKDKTLVPIKDRVIVSDMEFGERTTSNGIIITSDDGKDRGIRPRWGKVYAKGPTNDDEYDIGDWILVEHGRWTRGVKFEDSDGNEQTLRMVETESVLMWTDEEPRDENMGVDNEDVKQRPGLEDYKVK